MPLIAPVEMGAAAKTPKDELDAGYDSNRSILSCTPPYRGRPHKRKAKTYYYEHTDDDDDDDEENEQEDDEVVIIESASTPAKPGYVGKGKGKGKEKAPQTPASTTSNVAGKAKANAPQTPDEKPPAKKPRKAKTEPEEKRLKRYRHRPPQTLVDRIQRCHTQRMFVLDRRRVEGVSPPEEKLNVAGTTGNIYEVHIKHIPTCTCPDSINNGICKHILYVMSKVLKTRENLIYQAALLSSELEEIFAGAPPIPSKTGTDESTGTNESHRQKPLDADDCPICYSGFDEKTQTIVYCKAQCGTNLHKDCFDKWAATKAPGKAICVMCRTPWESEPIDIRSVVQGGRVNEEGYVNVADQLGLSDVRDYTGYNPHYYRYRTRYY